LFNVKKCQVVLDKLNTNNRNNRILLARHKSFVTRFEVGLGILLHFKEGENLHELRTED
jgi:hypothetical protein